MNSKEIHSLRGLWVRNAALVDKKIRLELSPSDKDIQSFLAHIHKLDDSGGFEIDVDPAMLEHIIPPDEVGTKEHKLAMLPGNCIDLTVVLDENHELIAVDGNHDASHTLSGDEKTGLRPTPKLSRLLRGHVRDMSRGFSFNHIRGFFRETNGGLVPNDETQPLKAHQKAMVRILTPYCKPFCSDASKVRQLKVSGLEGDYLGVEQRIDSIQGILDAEEDFGKQRPSSPIYGKVTLSDVLGAVADNSWEESSRQYLNATLKNTRLGYAVSALDNHIKAKLTPTIVDHMSKTCGKTFTPGQKQEVSREFQRFMGILIDAGQKRLDPLRKFCDSVGQVSDSTPEHGLAILNHLAGLSRINPTVEFKLADGTKLDFSAEMKKLFADPRTFGAPLENLPKNVQQAANAALLHYMSREMLSAYWEISNPSPSADSMDALLKETEQKVVARFTKRKDPVSNPGEFYQAFVNGRNLLLHQMDEYLGPTPDKGILAPPKSLNHRLMERSAGVNDVTRSRGLLLNSACTIFRKENIPDEAVNVLLREGYLLMGSPADACNGEVEYVMKAYGKSRSEAAYALLLHAAIEQHNVQLAQKLQEFGENNVKDFKQKLEDELDSRVRARTLNVATLGKRIADSPSEIYKALNPKAEVRCELANAKASIISSAAMGVLKNTLRRSLEFYRQSLPSSIELNNIEGPLYNGPQSFKMIEELAEEGMEDGILDFCRLSSIRDGAQREHAMNAHSANLAETASRSKAAVEIEADSKCYPGGMSPRRHAKQLLKDAINKAIMGFKGDGQIDPHVFAPPSFS
jgi:hypothetical protein